LKRHPVSTATGLADWCAWTLDASLACEVLRDSDLDGLTTKQLHDLARRIFLLGRAPEKVRFALQQVRGEAPAWQFAETR
jgi:hypothetical protein